MREIKYRVWNKELRKMEIVGAIDWDCHGHVVTCNTETSKLYRYPPEDILLMQYTGLKDKNGKEIYEGDIILCDSLLRRCPHEIIWTELNTGTICGTFGWYLTGVSNPGYGFTGREEIIGNIYDPELSIK